MRILALLIILIPFFGFQHKALRPATTAAYTPDTEPHLRNIRQLTFGGDNAEAYWSPNGKWLTFQSNNPAWGLKCDQIFALEVRKAAGRPAYRPPMVSSGKGRTTCSYFMPNGKQIIFASTMSGADTCPPVPNLRQGGKYLWPVYDTYDLYVTDLKGKIVRRLTNTPGYDAEAVLSPKGDKILFTSTRSGDLELWTMNLDGSNLKQITFDLGYDGGAFFSPDASKIVFRASRPKTEADIREYRELLQQGLVAPTNMEIYVCNADGSGLQQVTQLGKANWAPYFHPSGKKIIFSSNHHSSRGYDFQLYMVNLDGSGLEQITSESIFNSFAMFSPDGKKIAWCSNRNNGGTRDTNVFVADWVE
ncbi:MAG: PD40 domain-containing protein [Saprospirales bacterium]|nr:PD40 domain-containing protein [Saprospirales bacterium]MBK8921596.1 PD40 domain-containing protein [Saprospirales bacterium]